MGWRWGQCLDLWAVGSLGWSLGGGAALREARWKHHKPCLQGTPVQVGKKLSTGQEADRSRWCQGLSVLGTGLSPAAPAAHLLRPPPAPRSFCSQDPKPLTSSGNISLGDSGSFCFCSGLGVSWFLLPAFESSEAKSRRRSWRQQRNLRARLWYKPTNPEPTLPAVSFMRLTPHTNVSLPYITPAPGMGQLETNHNLITCSLLKLFKHVILSLLSVPALPCPFFPAEPQ